ncbi:hypothetical protein BT96DRAFT_943555 [Gymnopus androsaceus JB14]|uniref:VHS domain-containing protein n=1 Tax=Gymnopus androsaceus JB14 TaxID=1447944 RepID=A0A6A4H6Y9_9AGAR|nr:hypothetical protein BT96DRAFT_943555 [Gymnopus androsaceus JB14]
MDSSNWGTGTVGMIQKLEPIEELSKQHEQRDNNWKPEKESRSPNHIVPLDEDIRRLFQECNIGLGNARLLNQALANTKMEGLKREGVIKEFRLKCLSSQELIAAQISLAAAGANRTRTEKEREKQLFYEAGVLDRRSLFDEQTTEEMLLSALLEANRELLTALRHCDDLEIHITFESLQQLELQEPTEHEHLEERKEAAMSKKLSRKVPLEVEIQRLCQEREFGIDLRHWDLVLEVCERATSNEVSAMEAVGALRKELRYSPPASQLCAARLWAIMLRIASDIFLTICASRKFLDTLEDLLTSTGGGLFGSGRSTAPVVRERLIDVLAAAVYASRTKQDNGFSKLWKKVKPNNKPDEGVPLDVDDAMFYPPVGWSDRASAYYTESDINSITPHNDIMVSVDWDYREDY